ncbi:hypothetical protein LSH36_209g02020 [Paralvinella palmiformis]|uniref:Neurotransmitter-gated ion-channel ligand-binding domain-containing protein n=1 Tax=Paralvinella palmiformis TaxID=53620 RepID=A0AAD9JR19_9ANNE|nr:hypothetical protein LSH36_209g02020 [Paralvinella palmiformis]
MRTSSYSLLGLFRCYCLVKIKKEARRTSNIFTQTPTLTGCGLNSERRSDEERLLSLLFRYYNPSARPVLFSNNSVQVQIQFSLMHIQELEWTDERLKWQEDVYNLKEVIVEARHLWVPEFAVINGAEEIYGDYKEFRAIISSNGLIHWEPGGVFKTMCAIDITFFPFDDQNCSLVFGAWSYHTTKMNLTKINDAVNMDSYEKNGEWEILTTSVIRDEFAYECCPHERFSNVAFTVHMRRRYTFYVMNIILPSMVTSVLLLSIFFCPPAQKVQIGVVVLLSAPGTALAPDRRLALREQDSL